MVHCWLWFVQCRFSCDELYLFLFVFFGMHASEIFPGRGGAGICML